MEERQNEQLPSSGKEDRVAKATTKTNTEKPSCSFQAPINCVAKYNTM